MDHNEWDSFIASFKANMIKHVKTVVIVVNDGDFDELLVSMLSWAKHIQATMLNTQVLLISSFLNPNFKPCNLQELLTSSQ